jgi:hypothetical protein
LLSDTVAKARKGNNSNMQTWDGTGMQEDDKYASNKNTASPQIRQFSLSISPEAENC